MRYWYDTEFIEAPQKIDLISIGIVAEDGREFYAQNLNCDFESANAWVIANVFPHLDLFNIAEVVMDRHIPGQFDLPWMHYKEIGPALREFCDPEKYGEPEFWGWYSAYDHVALCWLFGAMIALPEGWPMYTRDLKQWCDQLGNPKLPKQTGTEHNALEDARWTRQAWQYLNDRVRIDEQYQSELVHPAAIMT